MSAEPEATCQLCGWAIEHRRIGELNDGTPVLAWCHTRVDHPGPEATFHCPTGGTGRFGDPSRRHVPA
jgi:hypothetical protein